MYNNINTLINSLLLIVKIIRDTNVSFLILIPCWIYQVTITSRDSNSERDRHIMTSNSAAVCITSWPISEFSQKENVAVLQPLSGAALAQFYHVCDVTCRHSPLPVKTKTLWHYCRPGTYFDWQWLAMLRSLSLWSHKLQHCNRRHMWHNRRTQGEGYPDPSAFCSNVGHALLNRTLPRSVLVTDYVTFCMGCNWVLLDVQLHYAAMGAYL